MRLGLEKLNAYSKLTAFHNNTGISYKTNGISSEYEVFTPKLQHFIKK